MKNRVASKELPCNGAAKTSSLEATRDYTHRDRTLTRTQIHKLIRLRDDDIKIEGPAPSRMASGRES